MRLDKNGYDLIKEFEGFSDRPYKCSAGVWTIGFGSTYYPGGKRVTKDDPQISMEQADSMFKSVVDSFAVSVSKLIKSEVTQNQFNALVSFAYNVGIQALKNSTLLKYVNASPNDGNIAKQFLRWNKSGGREIKGLTNRRIKESALYYTK